MDVTTVILCIQSLLDGSHVENSETWCEKDQSQTNSFYNQIIQHESIKTLLIKNMIDIPPGYEMFYNDMKNEIIKNKDDISKRIERLMKENPTPCKLSVPIYRINQTINYELINHNFGKLINKI